jgi:hypothetical protein
MIRQCISWGKADFKYGRKTKKFLFSYFFRMEIEGKYFLSRILSQRAEDALKFYRGFRKDVGEMNSKLKAEFDNMTCLIKISNCNSQNKAKITLADFCKLWWVCAFPNLLSFNIDGNFSNQICEESHADWRCVDVSGWVSMLKLVFSRELLIHCWILIRPRRRENFLRVTNRTAECRGKQTDRKFSEKLKAFGEKAFKSSAQTFPFRRGSF